MKTPPRITRWASVGGLVVLLWIGVSRGQSPTRDEAIARLQSYQGESNRGVGTSSLRHKVMCGYQGWFTAPGDGADRAWAHYSRRGRFEPGQCSIDLWPDMTELDADERYPTAFRLADGSIASVFSSHNRKTVLRHFQWMRDYGIDGVFVQRFAVETFSDRNFHHCNTVLSHCREGANRNGRAYAVMYDLSGLQRGEINRVIEDWRLLVQRMHIGRDDKDRAYLSHNGRPVVAVWGVGFNDGRSYTLDECDQFTRFLKEDPQCGGCTVMLGVPTGWRSLDRDSVADPKLHDVIGRADIISPWTVGRYHSPETAAKHAEQCWKPDLDWCRDRSKEYMPVVFPGFSWHNMKSDFPLDQIPRLQGKFQWTQLVHARRIGATMIYQAMFDEMDEGTAIFKCTSSPPVGASRFVTYENLPSDHYLWLTGMGARLLRGELEPTLSMPVR